MTNNALNGIGDASESEGSEHAPQTSWRRYFSFSTDHKVIGIQYLVTTFIFFLIGGLMAMVIRAELITPASDLVTRPVYNGLFTLHGTVMIFLWIIPSLVGLSSYFVPLMIGARDMAFPLLNAMAFWIILPTGLLLLSSFLLPSGTAQAGWWSYPPVSLQNPSGQILRLKDEICRQHLELRSSQTLQWVAKAVIGAIVAKKVLDVMNDGEPVKNKQ